MDSQHQNQSYVFIVTYGRSGSTLLQTILQSIDGYCIRGENNNVLYSIYHAAQKLLDAQSKIKEGSPASPSHPWYGADKFNPHQFSQKMVKVFIEEVLNPTKGTRVLGFKEIRYFEAKEDEFERFLNFISEFFTPCKFIFNTRKWQSVAKSGWWIGRDPQLARREVTECDRQFHVFAKKHPEISYLIQYEDYAQKPEEIEKLFQFLNEPFNFEKIRKIVAKRLIH